jgi:hypothetical protein
MKPAAINSRRSQFSTVGRGMRTDRMNKENGQAAWLSKTRSSSPIDSQGLDSPRRARRRVQRPKRSIGPSPNSFVDESPGRVGSARARTELSSSRIEAPARPTSRRRGPTSPRFCGGRSRRMAIQATFSAPPLSSVLTSSPKMRHISPVSGNGVKRRGDSAAGLGRA